MLRPAGSGAPRWVAPAAASAAIVAFLVIAYLGATGSSDEPRAKVDQWRAAVGVYACDAFLPPTSLTDNVTGIYALGEGLVAVEPFDGSSSGSNATIGRLLASTGATLTDQRYTPGPGEDPAVLDAGTDCAGEPARLVVARWDGPEPSTSQPDIFESDLSSVRFETDGSAITIALVPIGSAPPLPPAIDLLP